MKILLFSILFLITTFLNVYSQDPQIQWQNTIGGDGNDGLYSVVQTLDGGYLLGGESESNISGDKIENAVGFTDYWIVKLDVFGALEWQNNIGGFEHERLRSIFQTSTGDYIIGGYSFSNIGGDKTENSNGQSDFWVLKLDNTGNIIWQNTIGGAFGEELAALIPTADGGILIGGSSYSNISGDKSENSKGGTDYWFVKLDAEGTVEWDKTLGGNGEDYLKDIQETVDGGYILAGFSESNISGDKTEDSQGDFDYWILKTDAEGTIEWQHTIGGNRMDRLEAFAQTAAGGYIIAGESNSDASGDKTENAIGSLDYWVVNLDSSGNILWENTIGALSQNEASTIIQTNDGGFLVGGWSGADISADKTENSKGGFDFWIVKLNTSGVIEGQNTIGGSGPDLLEAIEQTPDGGYIAIGHSFSNISGDKTENSQGLDDFWVLKLNGILGINDNGLADSIKIFPNPTENIIQLEYQNRTIESLKIFDSKGSLIKDFNIYENISSINVSDLLSGVYFLHISSEGKIISKKFVKR